MRNYFLVEQTEDGLFLFEGTGKATDIDYEESYYWKEVEVVQNRKALFKRIRELLNK